MHDRSRAEFSEPLVQVVHERIVVVDDQDIHRNPPTNMRSRTTIAATFSTTGTARGTMQGSWRPVTMMSAGVIVSRSTDRRAVDLRLDLARGDGSRGHPPDLGRVREEPNTFRLEDLARDGPGDYEGGGHAAGQLASATEVRLAAVFHESREVSVAGSWDARVVRVGLRLHILVPDHRHDRLPGRRTLVETLGELHAILFLPLRGEEALPRSTAVELSLDPAHVDRRAGPQPLDRTADEGAMARPEDRRPIPRAEGVHPTTAWRAPSARMSSKNDG